MKPLSMLSAIFTVLLTLSAPAPCLGLDVGERAPAFAADSTRGRISLADYAGKQHVVLALYFAVFTPV